MKNNLKLLELLSTIYFLFAMSLVWHLYYEWFIAETFELKNITYLQAMGLFLVSKLIVFKYPKYKDKISGENFVEEFNYNIKNTIIIPPTLGLLGLLVSFFV